MGARRLLANCSPAIPRTARMLASSGMSSRDGRLTPGESISSWTCTAISVTRLPVNLGTTASLHRSGRHARVGPCGSGVHFCRGDQRQLLVCRCLLLLALVEQLYDVRESEQRRKRLGGAVGRDFVMLDALGGRDNPGVDHSWIAVFVEDFFCFRDETLHTLALHAAGPLTQDLEH